MSLENNKNAIDWSRLHRRLDSLRNAIDSDWQMDAAEVKKVLHQRARELSIPERDKNLVEDQLEILEFSLAKTHYAIESRFVREVCPLAELVPVPCTPSFVMGIVNIRNEFISVIDIRSFFGFLRYGLSDLGKVIVVESNTMVFGILVDSVVETRYLNISSIRPASNVSGVDVEYLSGMTLEGIVIIDGEKMLNDPRIIVNEEI